MRFKRIRRLQDAPGQANRYILLFSITLIFCLTGVARLFDLQVIRGSYFQALAEGNRIRRIPIKAPRGEILDRNGEVLARNIPRYNAAKFSTGGVIIDLTEISREEAFKIQTEENDSTSLIVDVSREYPLGAAAAHLLGYVNEASSTEKGKEIVCPEEQKSAYARVYEIGDLVGRGGVEEEYECILRGVNGEELVEVDARGRIVRSIGRKEPIAGRSLKLSIDAALQRVSFEALENAPNELGTGPLRESGGVVRGASLTTDASSGEVLALVSAPSYDPSTLGNNYEQLLKDENQPLFNRAIGGIYPPGSTYKIVTATAGLEEGVINRDTKFDDKGFISVGPYTYRNWFYTQYGRVEGEINIVKAITRSTDTFFYKIGEDLGVDRLVNWSKRFGLGEKTKIDLPREAEGLVPDPTWKEKVQNERWFLGNTYHMSIGQGDLLATPLQVNHMASVIANGGKLCRPHLLLDTPSGCADLKIKEETLQLIKEGMVGACSTGGTAYPLFNFEPKVACKTGTAQFSGEKTHAWLTAFAPVDNPQIVVTVLVEEGGEGSRVAAPVAKEVFQEWFKK
ncbi:MAG: penicillin-binding protein 2 [bacterium]|nr:penicillin-binding protein 2 [bacterium]